MNDRRLWETTGNEETVIGGPLVTPLPSNYYGSIGDIEPATKVFDRIDNKYDPQGLNAEPVEDDPDGVFVDVPTHFAVVAKTHTGRIYFSRWIHISKLTEMTDYHEKGQERNPDDWAAVYLPEGVVYIKYKDIESVTFVSRTWYERNYPQDPTEDHIGLTDSRTNGPDTVQYR